MRTVVAVLLTLVVVAALLFSPFSLAAAETAIATYESEKSRASTLQFNLDSIESSCSSVVAKFNDTRTFDVFYGDLERLNQILNGVGGIEILTTNVMSAEPPYDFEKIYEPSDVPSVIQYELRTSDPLATVRVLERMQLPVIELIVTFPETVTVTFMTGGVV